MFVGFLCLSISIICSILVSVFIKKNSYKKIDPYAVILINYIIATILSLFFFQIYNSQNITYIIVNNFHIILMIGCFLPMGFISMSQSIKYFGVAKSETFQRMSIVIPIIASFTIFNDKLCLIKIIYIFIAIISVFCLLDHQQKTSLKRKNYSDFKWPILVGFTYGISDILFKKISNNNSLEICLFLSFLIASIVMTIYILTIRQFFLINNSTTNGLLIGILNWINIFSYIKAHKYLNNIPSTVFIIMNLGVVTLGTIVGTLFFKEKLNKKNMLGIFMATISILISINIKS